MKLIKLATALVGAFAVPAAMAGVYPQCPFDVNGAGITHQTDPATNLVLHSRNVGTGAAAHRQVCLHVVAGDGWMVVGDSASMVDVQKLKGIHLAMKSGMLAAEATLQPWLIQATQWRRFAGVEVPSAGEVLWQLKEGDFPCYRWEITELTYGSAR